FSTMATMTESAPMMMTSEVPLVAGDMLRTIRTSVVVPSGSTPLSFQPSGGPSISAHRRRSSAASDMAKAAGIDLEAVSMAEARKIMSEEHKVLGFRPPQGSFAAEVQSVATKNPDGKPGIPVDTTKLKEMAREDALRILAERRKSSGSDTFSPTSNTRKLSNASPDKPIIPARGSPVDPGINLGTINATDARILMSHEHRALGFRPPPGSLAAEAQSAAARHPEGNGTHLDEDTLKEIAMRDAERIKADREVNIVGEVNVSALSKESANAIISAEAKALGHRPPAGSLAAQAQSAADKHPAGGSFSPAGNPIEMAVLTEAAVKEGERLRAEEAKAKDVPNEADCISLLTKRCCCSLPHPRIIRIRLAIEDVGSPSQMTETPPKLGTLASPTLPRTETEDSVEIICDIIALVIAEAETNRYKLRGLEIWQGRVPTPEPPKLHFFCRLCEMRRRVLKTPVIDPAVLADRGRRTEHGQCQRKLASLRSSPSHSTYLNRVVQSVSFTILYFDFFLTLPEEIPRYWKGQRALRGASLFFFLNRYLAIVVSFPVIYEFFWNMPDASFFRPRRHPQWTSDRPLPRLVLLMLRTYALYNMNKRVMYALSAGGVSAVVVSLVSLISRI
ncbi:uncharacterized protein BXZ73DRAFT_53870, partial [Epithele typhae]|uniref:uncharacterized protein n=1 Tax=Epithele typhae TaxID=378194 RepID=UPI0020089989